MFLLSYAANAAALASVTAAETSQTIDYIAPIASTGLVGVFLLMILFRVKIMPTYVYDNSKVEWDREREKLEQNIVELKAALADANAVYVTSVIPTLTRLLDSERELVELRRDEKEARRRAGM